MRTTTNVTTLILIGTLADYALAEQDVLDKYLPVNAAPDHHGSIIDNDSVSNVDTVELRALRIELKIPH